MTRDTAFLAEMIQTRVYPQGGSLVSFTLQLSSFTRKQLYRRLQQAYASGSLKLIKRIHALPALAQAKASVTWRRCCLSVSKPYVITGAIHHSGSYINREDRWNCSV